jgi:hypothetical protein
MSGTNVKTKFYRRFKQRRLKDCKIIVIKRTLLKKGCVKLAETNNL